MDIGLNYKHLKPRNYMLTHTHKKKKIDKTKNDEHVPSLELVETVLVKRNLVDNQYRRKSEVLHTFTPNKS